MNGSLQNKQVMQHLLIMNGCLIKHATETN